jgi:hypothetical protein
MSIASIEDVYKIEDAYTTRDMLNLEPLTSPPRKKSMTTFGSLVYDFEDDEEQTYLVKIGGGGGKKFNATIT